LSQPIIWAGFVAPVATIPAQFASDEDSVDDIGSSVVVDPAERTDPRAGAYGVLSTVASFAARSQEDRRWKPDAC
jgi:hypothetical protein